MRLFILGRCGSGKDTVRKLLTEQLKNKYPNLYSIDVGEILRKRAIQDEEVRKVQAEGGIVDSSKVFDIFEEVLDYDHFIVSGSPRKPNEAEWILNHQKWKSKPGWMIHLDISDEEVITRLLLRKREDDSEQIIKERLKQFHATTMESILLFGEAKRLLATDASEDPQIICKRIIDALEIMEIIHG